MKDGIIIMGMYHSGTTYLAKLLHDRGVKMCGDGGFYEGSVTGNHYEDAEVLEMNRNECRYIRTEDRMMRYNERKEFRQGILRYKSKRQSEGALWGVKEPRIALFSKTWMDVCRNCKLIICHRSPIRVSWTKVSKYWQDGHKPLDIQSTYSHTYGRVLDNWAQMKGSKMPLFVFDYDANANGHDRQNEALNKYLGFKLDYLDEWKYDT